jgi:hypothetical protein
MVRRATDVGVENKDKKKPIDSRSLSSNNDNLDRYII